MVALRSKVGRRLSDDDTIKNIVMRETNVDIRGGHSQVNPAATQAIQNNYYGSPIPIQDTDTPRTVVVPANRYTPIIVQGYPARKYDNRIIVVAAPCKRSACMKEDAVRDGQTRPGYDRQASTESRFITGFAFHPNPADTLTMPSFPAITFDIEELCGMLLNGGP